MTPHNWCRVTPFGHPGITARLTTPPGLSRPPTSFIGSWCQGIHTSALTHLTTQQRYSHPLYNSQHTTTNHPPARKPHRPDKQRGPETTPTSEHTHRPQPEDTPTNRQRLVPSQPDRAPHEPAPKHHNLAGATTAPAHRLPRKEVIQPHLPVRLPCYDFVPIASPTFDHSPPKRVRPWASGVADFRDVTGGVYKARERIHRSVADLRLLATPTSRGRVADPDPN